jgi:PTS system mannose-specific IIC component/fructoselysine and glucoselysine-specific PTS system IIC component
MFLAIAFGTQGLDAVLAKLPAWAMTGLGAASGMMIGIGIAILTSMIWSNTVGVFFFLGYVMVKFMNLSTLPIAVIGVVIAVTIFLQDKDVIDVKNAIMEKLGKGSKSSDEKGFFA